MKILKMEIFFQLKNEAASEPNRDIIQNSPFTDSVLIAKKME
jgi:hypothetical protein